MLQGKRVVLVPVEPHHLPTYVPWFADQDVLKYFGNYLPMNLALEEAWYEAQNADPSRINFAIEYEGEHIGGGGLMNIDAREQNAEVGLFIGVKAYWDQGLGQDTLGTLVAYGFDQLNLHRIYLRVFADNDRGLRAYEKVGFIHEGTFRDALWRHGSWQDMHFMSILRHEWQQTT